MSSLAAQAYLAQVLDKGLTTVTLQWDAAPAGFQGYYKVLRAVFSSSGSLSAALVVYTSTDLATTKYTDTGLQQGTHYRYTVQLYSASDQLTQTATVDACTLRTVTEVHWDWVVAGVIILILIILIGIFAAPLLANPIGITAVAALVVLAVALIGLGVTATSIVAGC